MPRKPYLLLILAACLSLAASMNGRAAMAEFDDCDRVPEEIRFIREAGGESVAPAVVRYERYRDVGWIRRDYKNPENSTWNGPFHGRNCAAQSAGPSRADAPGAVQRLSFRFRSREYFRSGLADHVAIVLRASFARDEGVTGGTQRGRGLAIFPAALYAEDFSSALGSGATKAFADDTWYSVDVVASRFDLAVLVTDESGAAVQFGWTDSVAAETTGYGFAILCAHSPNASCEYAQDSAFARLPFEVHFADIAVQWTDDSDASLAARHEKRAPRDKRLRGAR